MNQPDFRALAQELLQHARVAQKVLIGEGLWDDDDQDEGLFDRADAALATPPPEPQEAMIPDQYKGHQLHVYRAGFHAGYKHGLTRALAALTQAAPPTDEELLDLCTIRWHGAVSFARAVLERWG